MRPAAANSFSSGPDRAGNSATIHIGMPPATPAVERDFLHLSQFQPPGRTLTVNSRYLELDGQPWLPVMGEFHYSRYPADEWERELRKMQAGGVNIVASYVLWNHHQELDGPFDWDGQRDLRRFVSLVQRVGLYFYLRPGPWAHAEVRNGGFPDWLLARGPVRCNEAGYLEQVTRFFDAIGAQLRGLMWADGGPVIGVQLENEYDRIGPGCGAEHIAALQGLALAAGLRVPLYTVTGWPTLDIPARDVVPVSGAYADGFWSGERGPLPPSGVFLFNTSRAIGEMGNVGGTAAEGKIDQRHYPFFLAEAGGGMHVSYHRRPVVTTDDVAATALVQLGSGATLYGYYMYHGGSNPAGRATPLHETQASGYPNDVPLIAYDFRAPLGQYGQLRPSYGRLRCLHLFMAAFGAELAVGDAVLADGAGLDAAARDRLRVAARGAGASGFLFVNNHLRHHPLPDFADQRFQVQFGPSALTLPSVPVTVPSGAYFIWPLGQQIGAARLFYATVQPLTRLYEDGRQTWVLFRHPALPAECCFDPASVASIDAPADWLTHNAHGLLLTLPATDGEQVIGLTDAAGQRHTLLILTQAQADACYRFHLHGRDRLLLSGHGLYQDGDDLWLDAPAGRDALVRVFPADDLAPAAVAPSQWHTYRLMATDAPAAPLRWQVLAEHQPAPPLRMGPHVAWRPAPVPLAPDEGDYAGALRLLLTVDTPVPAQGRLLVAFDYIGDTARLYADGVLVDDNFNDGEAWLVGLDRYARLGQWPRFELWILPLAPDLPVFLEAQARRRLTQGPRRAALLAAPATLWQRQRVALAA